MGGIFGEVENLTQVRDGGESGIRTRGTSLPTRFPVVPVRPLRHLSVIGPSHVGPSQGPILAAPNDDRAGTRTGGESGIRTHGKVAPTTVFETVAFVRSAISPRQAVTCFPCFRSPTRSWFCPQIAHTDGIWKASRLLIVGGASTAPQTSWLDTARPIVRRSNQRPTVATPPVCKDSEVRSRGLLFGAAIGIARWRLGRIRIANACRLTKPAELASYQRDPHRISTLRRHTASIGSSRGGA